jgi:hypothetical protein
LPIFFRRNINLIDAGQFVISDRRRPGKSAYKYGEFESGSINLNKNTGNIAQTVMTVAGIAYPIVQNYKYDRRRERVDSGVNQPRSGGIF